MDFRESDEVSTVYQMECVYVGNYLYRCENTEVICYKLNVSLQCQFKV